MNKQKSTSLAVVAALCLMVLASCGYKRADANYWGCMFGAGWKDTRALKDELEPGEKTPLTNDTLKQVPADRRFYYSDKDSNTADFGGKPVIVPTRAEGSTSNGIVPVEYELQVSFVFSENACQWYVKEGKRTDDSVGLDFNKPPVNNGAPTGWATYLNNTLNQGLIDSAKELGADIDWLTGYLNGNITVDGQTVNVLNYLGTEMSKDLTAKVKAKLGGDYFCGPTYKYDGEIDGKLTNGCPDLEVTVKSLTPPQNLIDNLTAIAANDEAQKKIASDQQLAIAQSNKDKEVAVKAEQNRQETEIATAEANKEISLAKTAAERETQLAKAEADEAVKLQQQAVAEADNKIKEIEAKSQAAFCLQLASVGVDCALFTAAQNGNYPQYNLGDGALPIVSIPTPG